MPRKAKGSPVPELGQPVTVEEADDEKDPLERLLSELGADGEEYNVRLDRYNARNQREYLGTTAFGADLYEDVAREFGGGRYRGRIVPVAGGGYVRHIAFAIAGPPKPVNWEGAPAGVVPPPVRDVLVDETLRELTRELGDMRRELAELRTGGGSGASRLDEVLQIARALKEVANATPPTPERTPVSEMLATFRELMDLREEMAERAEPARHRTGTGEMVELARELGRPLLNILERSLPTPPGTPAPAPEPIPATAEPPMVNDPIPDHPVARFASRTPSAVRMWLARAARNDDDPDDVADTIVSALKDSGSPDDLRELDAVVVLPEFPDVFAAAIPELGHYPGWIRSLQVSLREARELGPDIAPINRPPAEPTKPGGKGRRAARGATPNKGEGAP